MKALRIVVILSCLIALATSAIAAERLRLATTTSTENSGLLAELLPPFEKANDCVVDVIAVGTGKAIKLGETGDVDVIMVHARSKEDKFVNEGYGIDRRDIMYNDFVILGPESDPAELKGCTDAAAGMAGIADSKSTFVSRGDDSGTHSREKQLWKKAGVTPAGDWYLEAGRGMGEVIVMAGERQGYTLSDRGTYIAYSEKTPLKIVLEGDAGLFNPYGAIMVNPAKHPHVKKDLAKKFLDYLVSDEAKKLITGFRKGGKQLFYVEK
ncbi:tungstate transport system substrate-binding protein [Malonomonas rubra DSM 5091]|uniref:Tungstate transport system substrate-binding protein n=1 Tax=Malonomonas rubra DSM 5091 TaxID=1122189 RepID=A0A1M6JQP3_MALRU|nr:substrate-binding domain-containing protein [Malonomonas rubra]SHJ48923.1 tungstate transport system substrate-binding protein [Malonomonas rubra DSM 5091]